MRAELSSMLALKYYLFCNYQFFNHAFDSAVIGDHSDIWLLRTFVNISASI